MKKTVIHRLGSVWASALLLGAALAPTAQAVVIPGGIVIEPDGGSIAANFLVTTPANAGFTSDFLFAFRLLGDPFGPLGTLGYDSATGGGPVGFGNLSGQPVELVFGIKVRETGETFVMGPGSRNPDGLIHANVDVLGPGVAVIGFEDLLGGGDLDYDDAQIEIRGDFSVVNVPAPAGTLPGLMMLTGMVLYRLRRR